MPFKRGHSGNPGGRPKAEVQVVQLARSRTTEAMEVLVNVMNDGKATSSARVMAANAILDRGWGRAPQEINTGIEVSGTKWILDQVRSRKREEANLTER